MSDLLPANATALERALAQVMAEIQAIPVPVRDMWNAATIPANALPWLAWAFSVDEWDINWSEAQKRETVRRALAAQKIKGTIGAVRQALGALGIDAQVQQWFAQIPAADPYTFRLLLTADQEPVNQSGIAAALAVVNATKNLRSHLTEILITARSRSTVITAAVTHIGHDITASGFQAAPLLINEFALPVGA